MRQLGSVHHTGALLVGLLASFLLQVSAEFCRNTTLYISFSSHCVFPALHRYIPISFLLLYMPLQHFQETAKGGSTYIIHHHHQRYFSIIDIRHGIWERRSRNLVIVGCVWVGRFLVSGCLGTRSLSWTQRERNDKTKRYQSFPHAYGGIYLPLGE